MSRAGLDSWALGIHGRERATRKVTTGQDIPSRCWFLTPRVHWTRSQRPGIKSQLPPAYCVIQAKSHSLSELLSS